MIDRRRWLTAMVVAFLDATGQAAARPLTPADEPEPPGPYAELDIQVEKADRRGIVIRYSDPINPIRPLLTLKALTGQVVPLMEVQDGMGMVVGGIGPTGIPFGTLGKIAVERTLRRHSQQDYGEDDV